MRDKCWYLVSLGEHEDNLKPLLLRQHRHQVLQLVTCLRVKADKRIVHDQHPRIRK